ncbi:hypothetical protein [Nakamurella sp. PAMC28650]|uniref:hypothetical protein n=1 Tax=Nakamurella sp. PAMC28650 TaxID=2762325 RepID=UPI00164E048F|nr:hypothetical protein [Nakamurella sp. PAMC28650]QNK82810.1 hypothetical protein H7F38_09100 [Nakamurella sp. PAMC28650]
MTEQQNLDTVPQMAVDAPLSVAAAGRAAGDVSSVLLIRTIVAAVATIVLVVAAVLLFRHGVRPDHFPAFLSGTTSTVITRYSAPWIAGAAGAALLAGLCFTSVTVDLFRRVRWQRARRRA